MDEALHRWVESTTGGAITSSTRHRVGGSRDLWFLEVAGRSLVLRAETGAGALTGTRWTLQREAAVCRALAGTGVPVAEIVAVSEQPDAVLMTRLPGTSDLRRLDPGDGTALVTDFMETLARVHLLDTATLDLPGFEPLQRAEDHALHDLARWQDVVAEHLPSPGRPLLEALEWLRDHAPRHVSKTVLVQGDTGPGNFLFEGRKVTGLVDWELSHLGDPMDDIAWLDVRGATGPFADAAVRDAAYERAAGIRIDAGSVAYYRVFVFLRCAVITGMAVARGLGTHGPGAYRAPHQRFLESLADAMAAADAALVGSRSGRARQRR